MTNERRYSTLDQCCFAIDDALRTVFDHPKTTGRIYPAENIPPTVLSDTNRKHSAACMRVNHAGEVSAQGLYHGQSLVSDSSELRVSLQQAAIEEGDHLAWCTQRLKELNSRKSWLTPFWYTGSFVIGFLAGIAGDRWSLGFLAETETQVMQHLDKHLNEIGIKDHASRAILQQMQTDETKHRDHALNQGAADLPQFIKKLMHFMSWVMVKTAYYF